MGDCVGNSLRVLDLTTHQAEVNPESSSQEAMVRWRPQLRLWKSSVHPAWVWAGQGLGSCSTSILVSNTHSLKNAECGWSSHWNYITVQNLDWPVSRVTPSWFLSLTKMAWFPYCEYHMLRLRLR